MMIQYRRSNQDVPIQRTVGSFPSVLYERRGRVAYITLNRPAALNAMNIEMHEDLRKIWDEFEADSDLWLAVLTGAGDRSFSVGQDLKELAHRYEKGEGGLSFGSIGAPGFPRLTERFDLSKPIIARVNGYAFGGGFELALASDIIVAAEHSTFALPEAKLGLIPGAGGLFRLARQIPLKTAVGYLMTGRKLSAQHALQFGLVNEVVPMAALDTAVDQWVEEILSAAPLSIRALKQITMHTAHLSLPDAFVYAANCKAEVSRRSSEDSKEGALAFVGKRKPLWKGR
jgi:dehydration protein DpgD